MAAGYHPGGGRRGGAVGHVRGRAAGVAPPGPADPAGAGRRGHGQPAATRTRPRPWPAGRNFHADRGRRRFITAVPRRCPCSSRRALGRRWPGPGMTAPPGACAREGVPWPARRSPHGERRSMAPAGRYSMKAVIRARGTLAHRQKGNARPARAIPAAEPAEGSCGARQVRDTHPSLSRAAPRTPGSRTGSNRNQASRSRSSR